jgi:outer membrane biosynthesis protein TonB
VGEGDSDRSQTEHQDQAVVRRRVAVSEAADILRITAEAVRTRIKRGKLDSVKDPPQRGGTVYVLLEDDQTRPNIGPTSQGKDQTADQTRPDALIESLLDQVAYLREQLAAERRANDENRRLLLAALERIPPQLEPPASPETPEPREEPERPLVRPERVHPERAEPAEPVDPQREEPERVPPERVEPERAEPQESPVTAADEQQGGGPIPGSGGPQEGTQRPWWRRVFGG